MAAVLIAGLLTTAARATEPAGVIDSFESADPARSFDLAGGGKVISTTSGFVYVVRADRRVWKSPKAWYYFAMTSKPEVIDLDGDGSVDVVWYGHKVHLAYEFGLFLSLRGGAENYFLHFDPWGKAPGSLSRAPLLEASSNIRPEVAKALAAYAAQRFANSDDRDAITQPLREGKYDIMRDPKDAYAELPPLHAKAVALFRDKKADDACEALDEFFKKYDFRRVDPENTRSEYTGILNDYGYFLSECGFDADTLPVLAYVLEREPGRAVAYLNMADALHKHGARDEEEAPRYKALAPEYYRKYHDLMVKAGKAKQIPKRVLERMAPPTKAARHSTGT